MAWAVGADTNVPFRLYDADEALAETGHCIVHLHGRSPYIRPYSIELPDGPSHPVTFMGVNADDWPIYGIIGDPSAIALHPDFFSAEAGGVRID